MNRYNNVAFIPVRGGSKSIKLKNIKMLCGKPLVAWTAEAALKCKLIDKVIICTDSKIIKETVKEYFKDEEKVECVDRPAETATDTASTESVLLYFANEYDNFNNIILVQATSPLLTHNDLENALKKYEEFDYDSMLSVVKQKRFVWKKDNTNNTYLPVNYDYLHRPRRQEFDGYFVENGAFYITTRQNLLSSKCRLSGNVGIYEMDEYSYLEIDEISDWQIIEGILLKRKVKKQNLNKIKMIISDCDGVLTDGGMYYNENGDYLKKFNTRDGMGISLLKEHDIKFAIITGENSEIVKRRAEKLGITEYYLGVKNKLEIFNFLKQKYAISNKEITYIGDDINDYEVMRYAGLACCPSNAVELVKSVADYVTNVKSGEGVVREVIDYILSNR